MAFKRSSQADDQWTTGIDFLLLDREKVAEGKGFEPLDRVNGRRFSRPLHVFQARQNQTKQDQSRLIVVGLLEKGVFVWFSPY